MLERFTWARCATGVVEQYRHVLAEHENGHVLAEHESGHVRAGHESEHDNGRGRPRMLTVRYGWLGLAARAAAARLRLRRRPPRLGSHAPGRLATALDSDRKEAEGATAWMVTMQDEDKDTAD